ETGQDVTVTLNGNTYHGTVAADGSWSALIPQAEVAALTDGASYQVTANVLNAVPAALGLSIDKTATITVGTPIAGDNVINAAESGQDLTITGATLGVEAGQIVTVTLNGHDSTAMVQADGSWSVSIPQADLAGLSNGVTYNLTASVSDQAGNQSSDNQS